MIALLLSAVLALPPGAEAVRIGDDTWPEKIAEPRDGDRVWWWSKDCAPTMGVECTAPIARRVQVVDRASGKKLPHARIVWGTDAMRTDLPDAMLPFAISDDNGQAVVQLPPSGEVRIRVDSPRAASWWQNVTAGAEPLRIVAVAASQAPLQLTVDGAPATRAFVQLELNDLQSWAVARDGRVLLPAIPPVPIRVIAWSEASAPVVIDLDAAQLPRMLELPRGVSVSGRIVDARRRPIEGAAIEAVVPIGKLPRGLRRRARTNRAGTFALRGVPIGRLQVQVKKSGHATIVRALDATEDMDAGDVTLRSARPLALRILDAEGQPIAGARARVDEGPSATAGRDGIARIEGAAADEDLTVHVTAKGFRATDIDIAADAKSPQDVVLSRGVRVIGLIVHAKNGERAGPGDVLLNNAGAQRVIAFDETGVIDIGGLEAGKLSLEIRAQALAPIALDPRTFAADDTWDLGTLQLNEGRVLTGHVIARDDDAPIAGARIRALRRAGTDAAMAALMGDWIATTTDDDGAFRVTGLAAEPHIVLVDAPGFASRVVAVDDDVETMKVELDRARSVVIDCTPVRRCGSEARLLYAGASYPWASMSATLTDGRARIVTAAPGTAVLRLVDRGEVLHEREVQIGATSETTVQIRLATSTLRGTVVSAGRARRDGGVVELRARTAPSAGLPIYLEYRTPDGHITGGGWQTDLPSFASALVDDAGNFVFDELEPGEYDATYRREGKASTPVTLAVQAGNSRMTLNVAPGELRGRVLQEDGRPAAFAPVKIVDAAGAKSVVQSDQFGHFETLGLAEGRAVVSAGAGPSTDIEVNARSTAEVEIVLRLR
jgi:hypothetical protein